jgi:hypothetical protein
MTCIVALHDRGESWVAADDRCLFHHDILPGPTNKVALSAAGDAALLICGEGAIGWQIVKDGSRIVTPDPIETHSNLVDFVLGLEKRGLISGIAADGYGAKRWNLPTIYANQHGVWDIDQSFMLSPISRGVLWARGSGGDLAVGAGNAADVKQRSPRHRVEEAIAVAHQFNAGCGPLHTCLKL